MVMTRAVRRRAVVTVVMAVACATGVFSPRSIRLAAQHDMPMPGSFDQPIRLFTTLGTYSRPISSANVQAKAYFDQGLRLMYAFAKAEAGRSFREAERR